MSKFFHKHTLKGCVIIFFFFFIIYQIVKVDEDKERQKHYEEIYKSFPPKDSTKRYRGWDFENKKWIEDEEYNKRISNQK